MHVWSWWQELNEGRTAGMHGANPLGWQDIDAFNRLKQLEMMPEEVELLRTIEHEYARHRLARLDPERAAALENEAEE